MVVWVPQDYLNDIPPNINEFTAIKKYLSNIGTSYASHISTNVGDDCAVYQSSCHQLISTDVAVEGVHFPKNLPAEFIARRAVASALSDIAAMGGSLEGFTLGLSISKMDHQWLAGLRKGLQYIARKYQVPLIGGDVVKGPTQLSVTAIGSSKKSPILRSGAKQNDIVCISGKLGGSFLGYKAYLENNCHSAASKRYLSPEARIQYGKCCSDYVNSMIDISDGIFQDLSHLTNSSRVGVKIDFKTIPFLSNDYAKEIIKFGDDYELLFTVSPKKIHQLEMHLANHRMKLFRIGVIDGKKTIIDNLPSKITTKGWDHFA